MVPGKSRRPTFAEMVSELKKPKIVENVQSKKSPVIAESVSLYDDDKAAWRVGRIQIVDPYGFHELDATGIARVKERLASLERSTWKDIFIRDAEYNHQIEVQNLRCQIAKKWMEDHLPDQPCLWTIRVTARERIWGILAEKAYQIVFWDPEHLIWEIQKR
jgi:hypothetical protein